MKDDLLAARVADVAGLPIDLSAGSGQEYVEDCPVCCCPNVIHVELDEAGGLRVWAERE